MACRSWLLGLFVALEAAEFTVIPQWSYSSATAISLPGAAFSHSDWTWLPSKTLPTEDVCFSTWIYPSEGANFLTVASGSMTLEFSWPVGAAATTIVNGSVANTISSIRVTDAWVFVAINTFGGVNTLVARRDGTAFMTDVSVTTFQLAIGATFKAPSSTGVVATYSDVVVRVGETIPATEVASRIAHITFLCGQSSGNSCRECHPSCSTCTSGVCDTCADTRATSFLTNVACLCYNSFGGVDEYHVLCGTCDGTCDRCWRSGDPNQCRTCPNNYAGYNPVGTLVGSCQCTGPYVPGPKQTVSSKCTPCFTGCSHCFGETRDDCVTQEQQDFMSRVRHTPFEGTFFNLDDYMFRLGLSCFRQPFVDLYQDVCDSSNPGGWYDSESIACKRLLASVWPSVTYWFDRLFPGFTGPSTATADQIQFIKDTLYMWILQFGASEMLRPEWDDIRNAVKASDWSMYLAWGNGGTPGYVTDGTTATMKKFPSVLNDTILKVERNRDVAIFNFKSTACDQVPCNIQTQCYWMSRDSNCSKF